MQPTPLKIKLKSRITLGIAEVGRDAGRSPSPIPLLKAGPTAAG